MKMRDVPTMESSFYEENSAQLSLSDQTPTIVTTTVAGAGGSTARMKRPLTLELNNDMNPAKRVRFGNNNASVISTPDLQMLKMVSPELEKIIMNGNPLATPTPLNNFAPKGDSNEDPEQFVKGFEVALSQIQSRGNNNAVSVRTGVTQQMIANNNNSALAVNNNNNQGTSTGVVTISTSTALAMSGGTVTYQNLDEPLPLGVAIKEEPQTVPSSPTNSFCPVDMDEQERQKLERKRQRNRVAASKCRKRKLERISKLEDKVKQLKGENFDLNSVVMNLKQHVMQLKAQIVEHVQAGCKIPINHFQGSG